MFRVLGFLWIAAFSAMFFAGKYPIMGFIFLAQTGFFLLLGYLRLSERMYMYIFGADLRSFSSHSVFTQPFL